MKPTILAVTGDQHAGSTVALCPPKVDLDDGGHYAASKAQLWLWEGWQEFWKRAAAARKQHGARFYHVYGGDMTDGAHHGTTQILSGNPVAQAAVVNALMKIPLALAPDGIIGIRGTSAHVGGDAAPSEERIFDGLRRDKRPIIVDPDTGNSSWFHFRGELNGTLLDITHHGRTGQREHTRSSAAVLHAHDIFLSHTKNGERAPDLALRAHYHRFNDSYDACPTRVITNGAWQLKTSYVHRVAADSMADIGGMIILLRDGKAPEVEKVHFTAARGPVWRPAA